jgi:signal transduction histidine kinase
VTSESAPTGSDAGRAVAALLRAERRQVSRELHGSSVQLLAAACLRLQAASLDGAPDVASVDAAMREIEAAMLALREMMDRLASTEVERQVVEDALRGVFGQPPSETRADPVSLDEAAELVARAAIAGRQPE